MDGPDFVKGVSFVNKSVFAEDQMDEMGIRLKHFIEVYNKKFPRKPLEEFKITIKEHSPEGKRKQYMMHARVVVKGQEYYAEKEDWDIVEVLGHVLDALRRQMFGE